MVFGDFDADGLDGLAILVLALRRYGLTVEPYVPSRLDEGHGLSLAAVDAAEQHGVALIVTVDTGSSSATEIARRGRHAASTSSSPITIASRRSCRRRSRSSTRSGPTRAIRMRDSPEVAWRSRSPS